MSSKFGRVSERLGAGLQPLQGEFNSHPDLHFVGDMDNGCPTAFEAVVQGSIPWSPTISGGDLCGHS